LTSSTPTEQRHHDKQSADVGQAASQRPPRRRHDQRRDDGHRINGDEDGHRQDLKE